MNILITGATGNIGREICAHFGKNHNIFGQYCTNSNIAEEIKNSLKEYKTNIIFFQQNFLMKNNLFQEIKDNSKIDILINCFSTYKENQFSSFKIEDLKDDIYLNSIIPLQLTKLFYNHNPQGKVINFLDSRALSHDPNHWTYSISKRLFADFTKECALNLAPMQINGIALGLTWLDPHSAENLPLKTKVSSNEIIQTIEYLIKSNITGEIIHLDSGRHIRK